MKDRFKRKISKKKNATNKALGVIIPITICGIYSYFERRYSHSGEPIIHVYQYSQSDCTYGDAVAAVSDSDMFSLDKSSAISHISSTRESSYYEAIIAVANSDMFSGEKRNAIVNISK